METDYICPLCEYEVASWRWDKGNDLSDFPRGKCPNCGVEMKTVDD